MEKFKIKQHTNKHLLGGKKTFWQVVSFDEKIKYVEDIFFEYRVPPELKLHEYRKCREYIMGMYFPYKDLYYTVLFEFETRAEAQKVLKILNSIAVAHELLKNT